VSALGPDLLIDYTKEDITERDERYDVVLDIAATRSIGRLRGLLERDGIFVQAGASKSGWPSILARIIGLTVRSRLLRQRAIMYIARPNQADLTYLGELIVAGKVRPVVDRTYPLTEAVEAVRYLGTGQARAKVVITVG